MPRDPNLTNISTRAGLEISEGYNQPGAFETRWDTPRSVLRGKSVGGCPPGRLWETSAPSPLGHDPQIAGASPSRDGMMMAICRSRCTLYRRSRKYHYQEVSKKQLMIAK